MEKTMYFTGKEGEVYKAWHVALEPGSSELQDVIIPRIPFDDLEMIGLLLETDHVKAKPVETEDGGYLLLYDGKCGRPYPSVMIWRYITDENTDENLITDMEFRDSEIIEYVWDNYLMEEGHDQEFTRPGYFILMEKSDAKAGRGMVTDCDK